MKNNQTLFPKSAVDSSQARNVTRRYVDVKSNYLFVKRIFDISFSICFLALIGTWLFPLIAILVLIDSRGPIFFTQRRVGKGGRTFNCIKFRTMVVNSEANCKQAEVDDKRITRLGRFLRNSSLDEIPQFINVLAGQMSVVGPRPHMHSDCLRFAETIPAYKFRNFAKPGITGLAQVKGFRGPALAFESIFHRYQYDAFYVRNCNFWLDMRIVRKTAVQTVLFLSAKLNAQAEKSVPIEQDDFYTMNPS
jgi:putative colanic acid biosynthesis UDP-glucose lipid carrier transferase